MNNLKKDNSCPDFVNNCSTHNVYNGWTLFAARSDEILESDIRPYDGQSSFMTVDLTFII